METNSFVINDNDTGLYKNNFNASFKNYSFCSLANEIIIIPNAALKILSILYESLKVEKFEFKENSVFVFEIDKIISVSPRNFQALQDAIAFLINFNQKDSNIEWDRIVFFSSISENKIHITFNKYFIFKVLNNIKREIQLFKSDIKLTGSSVLTPLELNL